jgi:hypothetical protein
MKFFLFFVAGNLLIGQCNSMQFHNPLSRYTKLKIQSTKMYIQSSKSDNILYSFRILSAVENKNQLSFSLLLPIFVAASLLITTEMVSAKDAASILSVTDVSDATSLVTPTAVSDSANDYGILAGRTASLLHPVTNFALFGTSLYSLYLGLQWRRQRELGAEIKQLGEELPVLSSGSRPSHPLASQTSSLLAKAAALTADTDPDPQAISDIQRDLSLLRGAEAVAVDARIGELTAERKALSAKNLKDKHFLTGSVLLGVGVSVSILGALNTYLRAGKLFPGPHLYAGAAITILWAGDTLFCSILQLSLN